MSVIRSISNPAVNAIAWHLCSALAYPLPIDPDADWSYRQVQAMGRNYIKATEQCRAIEEAHGAAIYAVVGIGTRDGGSEAFSVMAVSGQDDLDFLHRYIALHRRLSPLPTIFSLIFVVAKQGMLDSIPYSAAIGRR